MLVVPGLLAILLLGVLVWSARDEARTDVSAVGPERFAASPSLQGGHMAIDPGGTGAFESAAGQGAERVAGDTIPVEAIYRFEGTGSIRGEVRVAKGSDFPSEYRVVVEPSRVLTGRQHAERRERAVGGGEPRFELRGLPLGGYDLRVEAPGMNADRIPVLLCEGAEDPFVTVTLRPTGFVDGTVVDANGAPAEGLLVTLEPLHDGARREARTGPSGGYLLEDVPDGEYRIFFGPAHDPIVPVRELSFRAPSMNFPKQTIPALASFEVRTYDDSLSPLGGVRVSGFGSAGGQFELVTDDAGLGQARFLPPGTYRIVARHESGSRDKLSIEVDLETPEFVQLFLRP